MGVSKRERERVAECVCVFVCAKLVVIRWMKEESITLGESFGAVFTISSKRL